MTRLTILKTELVLFSFACTLGGTLCTVPPVNAGGLGALNRRITLRARNEPIQSVLSRLSSQYRLITVAMSPSVEAEARFSNDLVNVPLRDAFDAIAQSLGAPWQYCGEVVVFSRYLTLPWWNLEANDLGIPGAVEEATIVRADLTSDLIEFLRAWSMDHFARLFRDGSSILISELNPQEKRALQRLAQRLGIDSQFDERATVLFKPTEFGQAVTNYTILGPLLGRSVSPTVLASEGNRLAPTSGEFSLKELSAKLTGTLNKPLFSDRRLESKRVCLFASRPVAVRDVVLALSHATGGELRAVGPIFHIGLPPVPHSHDPVDKKQRPHRIAYYDGAQLQSSLSTYQPFASLLRLGGRIVVTGPSGFKCTIATEPPA